MDVPVSSNANAKMATAALEEAERLRLESELQSNLLEARQVREKNILLAKERQQAAYLEALQEASQSEVCSLFLMRVTL